MPFPSFTLALSRQEAVDNESNNGIQERNAEPPIDLMVSCDLPVYDNRIELFG